MKKIGSQRAFSHKRQTIVQVKLLDDNLLGTFIVLYSDELVFGWIVTSFQVDVNETQRKRRGSVGAAPACFGLLC